MGATFSLAKLSQFKNIYYIVSFFGSKTARQCQILVGGCADHCRPLNGRFSRLTSRLLEIGVCLFQAVSFRSSPTKINTLSEWLGLWDLSQT